MVRKDRYYCCHNGIPGALETSATITGPEGFGQSPFNAAGCHDHNFPHIAIRKIAPHQGFGRVAALVCRTSCYQRPHASGHPGEKRNEMKVPPENGIEKTGIKSQIVQRTDLLKSHSGKHRLPFRGGSIPIGKRDAILRVSHPIHESKSVVVQPRFAIVVFDDDTSARDACRLQKKILRQRRVVKDVDE
jgi:hypothetical protein